MKANNQLTSMYETNQTVAALNKVAGFDPRICLRRTTSQSGNQEVLKLDLRYKKLWFRLAYPTGRIKTTALRITEQLAIIEAKVYLDRNDTEPVSNFTAKRSIHDTPGGLYIQAAQYEAQDIALNDAGFGLQFSDVSIAQGEELYGSELPLTVKAAKSASGTGNNPVIDTTAVTGVASTDVTDNTTAVTNADATTAREKQPQNNSVEENNALSLQETSAAKEITATDTSTEITGNKVIDMDVPMVETTVTKDAVTENATAENISPKETPAEATLAMNPFETTATPPHAETTTDATPEDIPGYTKATPVDELLTLMTYEDACNVFVDIGTCNGLAMKTVAERRPASLKWYIHGYNGDNNILRAAAQIMLDSLSLPKAG